MRFVVGVDSVHTAGAVCDYLEQRLATTADSDTAVSVVVVAVDEDRSRDAADAANVVQVRLTTPTVRVETRRGDPCTEIQDIVATEDADEVVIGAHRGEPGSGPEIGDTARFLLRELDRPVVVVPVPTLPPA